MALYKFLILFVVLIAIIYPLLEPSFIIKTRSTTKTLGRVPLYPYQRRLEKKRALQLEFYDLKCPKLQERVNSSVSEILSKTTNAPAQLLRLMFHDCFIHGCDGSVLLGNETGGAERNAPPNRSLKGFEIIEKVKVDVEITCPGVVSCSDLLVLATRDAINQIGGPFFVVPLGRKDSREFFFQQALADIPNPNGNISETLRLFKSRGFSPRETVSLLGGHNIGLMGCQFITTRFSNFKGTAMADQTLPSDFLVELRTLCENESSIRSGTQFGPNYFTNLVRGRGLLFADQQLMENDETAQVVKSYASDSTGIVFRADFARAMTKLSQLLPSGASQGEVRLLCSRKNSDKNPHNSTQKSAAAATKLKIAIVLSVCFWLTIMFDSS